MVKTSCGSRSWEAVPLQMCSAMGSRMFHGQRKPPPKQGPSKPQKPWAASSEAHTAALLPGSRAVTGAGSCSRRGSHPEHPSTAGEPKHTAATSSPRDDRHVWTCSCPGMDGHPRILPKGRPQRLAHRPARSAAANASRLPRETSALQKPNHQRGHNLTYHITQAGDREGKMNPCGTPPCSIRPNAIFSRKAASFLPPKCPLPSKPQEPSPVTVSERLPVFTVQR